MEQVHLFTKKLKPTHISHTLSVPTHVLQAFPFPEGVHMMNFEAVDATDNAWRFCLSTRLTGAYPKPVLLRSSWHRFVEQKGLAPEDRVVFFMERDEANDMVRRYKVRAQRKVMILMGQDVWVDVEDLPPHGLWRLWPISCSYEKSPSPSTGSYSTHISYLEPFGKVVALFWKTILLGATAFPNLLGYNNVDTIDNWE